MNPEAHRDAGSRAAHARELLRCCTICPRNCAVDRMAGDIGYCRLGADAYCFREVLHFEEEEELNPSHQIYFSGCNLVCEYCTVLEWVKAPMRTAPLDLDALVQVIHRRRDQGAETLNLLGGEPAVSIHIVLELLARIPADTRVVWNSNMYYAPVIGDLLDGLVDVFLADFKCGNNACAGAMLRAPDYVEVVQRNLLAARSSADVIVRHLLLPGHRECCLEPVVEWVARYMPDVKFSLRNNYLPPPQPTRTPPGILSPAEISAAMARVSAMGLKVIS